MNTIYLQNLLCRRVEPRDRQLWRWVRRGRPVAYFRRNYVVLHVYLSFAVQLEFSPRFLQVEIWHQNIDSDIFTIGG